MHLPAKFPNVINLLLSFSGALIFSMSPFVFTEHHQEGDWAEVCVQVCLFPGDTENGPSCRGDQPGEPFAAGQRLQGTSRGPRGTQTQLVSPQKHEPQ